MISPVEARAGVRRSAAVALLACSVVGCGGSASSSPVQHPSPSTPPSDDLTAYVGMSSSNLARIVADPARPYVYVSDGAANVVHFFSTDTYLVERSVPVGSNPGPMQMTPDGALLFVALRGGSSVAVLDLATQSLLSRVAVPGTPENIAIGASHRLYVSARNNPIYAFDTSTFPAVSAGTVSSGPFGIVLGGGTADGSRMFTHDASTSLALTEWDISGATATQVATADVCSGPTVITSSADGATFAFVQDSSYFDMSRYPLENGDVPIFRTADMLREATVNVELNPAAVAICPGTGAVAVAHSDCVVNPTTTSRHSQGSGDLHTFDGETHAETKRYQLRSHVRENGIACGPDGRIYVILQERSGPPASGYLCGGETDPGRAIGVIEP